MSIGEQVGDAYRKVKAYFIMLRHRISKPGELDWITPNLAIGYDRRDFDYLKSQGINALIGLQAEHPDDETRLKQEKIDYLYIPIKDGHPPEVQQIQQMVDWINKETTAGHKVYMHCAAGVGRATTMGIAYLVSTGLTVDEAYEAVKSKHHETDPSPRQLDAVRSYLATINGSPSLGKMTPPDSDLEK